MTGPPVNTRSSRENIYSQNASKGCGAGGGAEARGGRLRRRMRASEGKHLLRRMLPFSTIKTREREKKRWMGVGVREGESTYVRGKEKNLGGSQCYKNFFGRNLENLDLPLNWKKQKLAIFKAMNSFRVKFCLKIAGSDIRTNVFLFLNFGGNLDFLKNKFYNINCWSVCVWVCVCVCGCGCVRGYVCEGERGGYVYVCEWWVR